MLLIVCIKWGVNLQEAISWCSKVIRIWLRCFFIHCTKFQFASLRRTQLMFIYYKRDRFLNLKKKWKNECFMKKNFIGGKIKNVKTFLIFRRGESHIALIRTYSYGILTEIFFTSVSVECMCDYFFFRCHTYCTVCMYYTNLPSTAE